MKHLLIILAFIFTATVVNAQASTIVDNGNSITVEWDDGDTLTFNKDELVIAHDGSRTYIYHGYGTRFAKTSASLDYTDFGYVSNNALRAYLDGILNRNYNEQYKYTSGNIDTIFNIVGVDTAGYFLFGYTTDTLTSKIWIPW